MLSRLDQYEVSKQIRNNTREGSESVMGTQYICSEGIKAATDVMAVQLYGQRQCNKLAWQHYCQTGLQNGDGVGHFRYIK